jgi:hypothetical protein
MAGIALTLPDGFRQTLNAAVVSGAVDDDDLAAFQVDYHAARTMPELQRVVDRFVSLLRWRMRTAAVCMELTRQANELEGRRPFAWN